MTDRNDLTDEGWSEWTSAGNWDTSKEDVQFECIDGIHRTRTRPRKPKEPREFWITSDYNVHNSRYEAERNGMGLGCIIHVREVL